MNEERIGCEFCYYEYFDGKAYPCSMCIRGEERTDKFEPKGRQTKQTETKGVRYCNECKWFRDKQVCGRCRSRNLFAEADTPQTDCGWSKPNE